MPPDAADATLALRGSRSEREFAGWSSRAGTTGRVAWLMKDKKATPEPGAHRPEQLVRGTKVARRSMGALPVTEGAVARYGEAQEGAYALV